ncbi:MAG: BolA family transcriptional regulator [Rickettsiaceae bacterium]|nr:BolA family transcriptional regulator [Rickettsiaceae bacterium]
MSKNIKKITIKNIEKKLLDSLAPTYLEITDESSKHASHNPNSRNNITHIKILIYSHNLKILPIVQSHRLIYQLLSEELENGLHSIEIKIKTPPLN